MIKSNQFGNSKNNSDSSNYTKNKKNRIIYNNIIKNDFQNIDNLSFRSTNQNAHIYLKSIGGFNILSQSSRIDSARGRSQSESFHYLHDTSNIVINQLNPTCSNDGYPILSKLNNNINLSFDIDNSNFLTTRTYNSCNKLLSYNSRFNESLIRNVYESNINKFINNDKLINLSLGKLLLLGNRLGCTRREN